MTVETALSPPVNAIEGSYWRGKLTQNLCLAALKKGLNSRERSTRSILFDIAMRARSIAEKAWSSPMVLAAGPPHHSKNNADGKQTLKSY